MLAAIDILLNLVLEEKKSLTLPTWIGAGFFIGLGLLSKYHAIFIPLGMGLFLLTTVRRRLLLIAGPYLALLFHWQATGWLCTATPQWFAYGDPSLDALDWRELPAAIF